MRIGICFLCDKQKKVMKNRKIKEDVCGNCNRKNFTRKITCASCGKLKFCGKKIDENISLCNHCANKEICSQCEKYRAVNTRVNGRPICCVCNVKPESCGVCNKMRPVATRTKKHGAVCSSCNKKLHPIKCAGCGKIRPMQRRKNGLPYCGTCGYHEFVKKKKLCVDCGKLRRIAKRTARGGVCGLCYRSTDAEKRECALCHDVRIVWCYTKDKMPVCYKCYLRAYRRGISVKRKKLEELFNYLSRFYQTPTA
jgi:hypothetical protein